MQAKEFPAFSDWESDLCRLPSGSPVLGGRLEIESHLLLSWDRRNEILVIVDEIPALTLFPLQVVQFSSKFIAHVN
jgi:hypothetical protein